MNFFGSSSTVKGPDVVDLKATFENLQSVLSSRQYHDGLDQATAIAMIGGIYSYITGKLRHGLPLPAPASDPEDKYRVMWPEGMRVRTRRQSVSSTGSGHHHRRGSDYNLNPNVTTQRAMSRASSATSTSMYSTRYVGIVEEEDDEPPPRPRPAQRQPLQRHNSRRYDDEPQELPLRPRHDPKRGSGTQRVNVAAMKPTPSMEDFMRAVPNNDEEPDELPRPARRSYRAPERKSRFADDEAE